MKRQLLIGLMPVLLFWSGCTTPSGLGLPSAKPQRNEALPGIDHLSIKSVTDMAQVGFEWVPVADLKVEGYSLYRSKTSEGNFSRIQVVKGRYASHAVDTKLEPATAYYYRFATVDKEGRESIPSSLISVATQPRFAAISWVEAVSDLPRQIKVIWRPHDYRGVKEYIVLRNDPTRNNTWQELAVLDGRLQAEYIDRELEDGARYQYRVLARTFDGVDSLPSAIVEGAVRKKPIRVGLLSATQGLPRKIVLNWTPSDQNISHYQIYRSTKDSGGFEPLARTEDANFTDEVKEDGVRYFYKVTVWDKMGLESAKQESPALGASKSRPARPKLVSSIAEGNRVTLRWREGDERPVRYSLIKREKKGMSWEEQVTKDLSDQVFVDDKLATGVVYRYQIIAVDADGLASEPSEEAEVTIKSAQEAR